MKKPIGKRNLEKIVDKAHGRPDEDSSRLKTLLESANLTLNIHGGMCEEFAALCAKAQLPPERFVKDMLWKAVADKSKQDARAQLRAMATDAILQVPAAEIIDIISVRMTIYDQAEIFRHIIRSGLRANGAASTL